MPNGNIKLYTPPMAYKLYYRNDEGRMTYDDYIPANIMPMYRDEVAEALDDAYVFRVKHPNVIEVTPGVELVDGELHGTLDVSLNDDLPKDSLELLRESLTTHAAEWGICFDNRRIPTDGGNLYV
jgi:hypothetical protein